MNVWADKLSDMRLSLNDLYMAFLMIGWMLLLMGLVYENIYNIIMGSVLVVVCIYLIRKQVFISEKQYLLGMIPHHSMAIHMSKEMLEKGSDEPLLKSIVDSQRMEIEYMKRKLRMI